ncbi:hypothetical protein J4216_01640 [Candidatus Woesearchaeota archaeon]|nr:hypothetical protein [Candidatus Woesearchaeota archaeon]
MTKCKYEYQQIGYINCNYNGECPYKKLNEGIRWELDELGPTCERPKDLEPPKLVDLPNKNRRLETILEFLHLV